MAGVEGKKLSARAMYAEARLLLKLKRNKEAQEVMLLLIRTFEDTEEPYVRSLVEKALEDLNEWNDPKKESSTTA